MKSGEVTGIELDEKSMRIPFKIFPADRLSDDHTVEDRIHNAEVAMREKCAKLASTPESTNEEVMRIARYDPTSWAAGYLAACINISERIRSLK